MLQSAASRVWLLATLVVMVPAVLLGADGSAPSAADAVAKPVIWMDPDGGWLIEYKVKFKGLYHGTAADPADQPLRQVIDAARTWAQAQGLQTQWYTGYYTSAAEPGETLGSAVDAQALGMCMTRLTRDMSEFRVAGSNTYSVPSQAPKDMTFEASIGLALPQGNAAQRDSLHAALSALPGVTLAGGWPLANYAAARNPGQDQSHGLTINGQFYNWPTDFTPAERAALRTEMAMVGARSAGTPWQGDFYKAGHPLSTMPRFGLGPLLRFRYAGGALSIESVPVLADFTQLKTVSWNPTVSFMVDMDEADLPFNPGELLIDASQQSYESEIRSYQQWEMDNAHAYRATVALEPGGTLTQEALDGLLGAWRQRYPELAPGGVRADAVRSGLVQGGDHPQWQATLAMRSDKLAKSLLAHFKDNGTKLESFVLVRPTAGESGITQTSAANQMSYYGSDEDKKWAWELRFRLVPKDPHGFDPELAKERIGNEAAAATIKVRDQLKAKYEEWLKQQQYSGTFQEAARYHFQGYDSELGIVDDVVVQARDEAEAQALRQLLAGPGVPEPEVKKRQVYTGGEWPKGMYLRWRLIPAASLKGILPEEAKAKLDAKVTAKAEADAAAIQQALAKWLADPHPAKGADGTDLEPRLDVYKFGEVPRVVAVGTPYPEGKDLDAFEAALRAAASGLPAPKRTKPYNYAFEPQEPRVISNDKWRREILAFELVPWERLSTLEQDEQADALTDTELKRAKELPLQIEAAIAKWNAAQPEADRVTVDKGLNDAANRISLIGGNPKTAVAKSLMAALDAAGLTDYQYGSGFRMRNQPAYYAPGAGQQIPATRLYYKLVPRIYTMNGGFDNLETRLARYYTPQQLESLRAVARDAEAAVATWAAENKLTFVKQYRGGDSPDSVRINKGGNGGELATMFQATIAVEDAARRAELAQSLEQYLAQRVPGLPKRDTSGSYMYP